jgi:cobalt-zinc-cadmium efflux system protein
MGVAHAHGGHSHGPGHDHSHDHDHDHAHEGGRGLPPPHGATCEQASPASRARDAAAQAERQRDLRRLLVAIGLTGVIFVAEIVGGLYSGSLALLSDAGHMLTDVSAQVISLLALLLATRPANAKKSYGYRRLEILAALANGVLLVALSAFTLYTAVRRFGAPPEVKTDVMLVIASIGLVANAVAAFLLHGSHSMNVRGAYLHIMSDMLSSLAVVVGGVIMWWKHGLYALDPVLGCIIGLLVLVSAWRLVREATDELLEAVPRHIDLDVVRQDLCGMGGIAEVHDLHVWSIGSGLIALSAHVVATDSGAGHHDALLHSIDELMRRRHGIHHSTVQIESAAYESTHAH